MSEVEEKNLLHGPSCSKPRQMIKRYKNLERATFYIYRVIRPLGLPSDLPKTPVLLVLSQIEFLIRSSGYLA
jgi:hypothetical protein